MAGRDHRRLDWRLIALPALAFACGWFVVGLMQPGAAVHVSQGDTKNDSAPSYDDAPRLKGVRAPQSQFGREDQGPGEKAAVPTASGLHAMSVLGEVPPGRMSVLQRHAPDLVRLMSVPLPLRALHHLPKDYYALAKPIMTNDGGFRALSDAMERRGMAAPRLPGRFSVIGFRATDSGPFEVVIGRTERLQHGMPKPFLEYTLRELGCVGDASHPNWSAGIARVEKYLATRAVVAVRCLRAADSRFLSGGWERLVRGRAFMIDGKGAYAQIIESSRDEGVEAAIRDYFQTYRDSRARLGEMTR